jgi:sirohydrochlorin ferrochelatase
MNDQPTLLITAHGTQSSAGTATLRELADRISARRPAVPVELCFLDVLTPTVSEALAKLPGPVVLVPAILSTGYHIRHDIPAAVGARADVIITPHLGPDPLLSIAIADQLVTARAGRPQGSVVLLATGSSDPAARVDLDGAADDLSRLLQVPVRGAAVTDPDLALAGAEIASYLLADGVFAETITQLARRAGATVVSKPIGAHPAVVQLILDRYDSGLAALDRRAASGSSGMLGR